MDDFNYNVDNSGEPKTPDQILNGGASGADSNQNPGSAQPQNRDYGSNTGYGQPQNGSNSNNQWQNNPYQPGQSPNGGYGQNPYGSYGQNPYPSYYQPSGPRTNVTAIDVVSLIFGTLSIVGIMTIFGGIICGIVAIVSSAISRVNKRKFNGCSIAGLITGINGIVFSVLLFVLVLYMMQDREFVEQIMEVNRSRGMM